MAEKTKIAVIGTGWWTTTAHIPALKANSRAEIVLVDKNPFALNAAAEKYGLKAAYTSLEEAIHAHPALNGAIVAVPHAAHDPVVRKCLTAGYIC